MSVHCGGLTTDPASKRVCVEIEIDNDNENPVQVIFQVCEETVPAGGTVPVATPSQNLPQIRATYTVAPGTCVVSATCTGAAGGKCFTQLLLPV